MDEAVSISQVQRKSQIELILATTGFLIVAMFCTITGYFSQGTWTQPDWIDWSVKMIGFVFPLAPYYYLREAILEQKIQAGENVKRLDSVQFSLIYFILSFLVFSLILRQFPSIPLFRTIIIELVAYLPFGYLGMRLLLAAKSEENLKNEYRFVYRVLFPGLSTCIIPFAFGWTIKEGDFSVLITSFLFVILGNEACRYKNLSLPRFLFVLFAAIFVSAFVMHLYNPLSVIVFGSLLSFGMGASEACKRVYLVKSGKLPLAEGEDTNFYLAGANWANSIFPVLLCLLPLMVIKFPTAPILIYTGLHVFVWQVFLQDKSGKKAFIISILLGYMLPLLIVISTKYWAGSYFIKNDYLGLLFAANFGVLAAVFGLASRFFDKAELKEIFFDKLWRNESYLDGRYSFWLFLMVIFIMELVIVSLTLVFSALDDQAGLIYKLKASEIQLGLLTLLILRTLAAGIQGTFKGNGDESTSNGSPELGTSELQQQEQNIKIIALLKIMRPGVSIITGIFVTCALIFSTNISLVRASLLGLPIILVTMLGFIFNDLIDCKKDCLTGADKPIAKGLIKKNEALFVGSVLMVIMSSIECIVGTFNSHLVLTFTLLGVFAYSYIANWASWAKGIVTAILCLSPFAYYSAISGQNVPLPIMGCLFLFIIGRELLMDSMELVGDLNASVRTLAFYLGGCRSRIIAWISMMLSVSLLNVILTGNSFTVSIVSGGILFLAFLVSWRNEDGAILLTRVSMVLGAVAVALSL